MGDRTRNVGLLIEEGGGRGLSCGDVVGGSVEREAVVPLLY